MPAFEESTVENRYEVFFIDDWFIIFITKLSGRFVGNCH